MYVFQQGGRWVIGREFGGAGDGWIFFPDRRGYGLVHSLFRAESTEGLGTDWSGMGLVGCDNTCRYGYSGERGALC